MWRWYALVLAETAFAWEVDTDYAVWLTVTGNHLRGTTDDPMRGGSAGFVIEVGTVVSGPITVRVGQENVAQPG
jgi:hypothetical protein